jgi:hypothetical protein
VADLPYTYTDSDGVALRVDRGIYTAYDRPGRTSVSVYAPKGDNAVRMARAILAADGHTRHRVISVAEIERHLSADAQDSARSMRERAARWMENTGYTVSAAEIRGLPLLPDGDDTVSDKAGRCPSRNPGPDGGPSGQGYVCALKDGHTVSHRSYSGDIQWTDGDGAPDSEETPANPRCPWCEGGGHQTSPEPDEWPLQPLEMVPCECRAPASEGSADRERPDLDAIRARARPDVAFADAAALAASANDVPALLSEVDRLTRERDLAVRACAAPGPGPGEICGTSVEGEPCEEHTLTEVVRRLELRMIARDRDTAARLDALEERLSPPEKQAEAAQSGGAEHEEPIGGPCPANAYNEACVITMVCHHYAGHTGPHYNPAVGGWEWDESGTVTQLDGRTPTHLTGGA